MTKEPQLISFCKDRTLERRQTHARLHRFPALDRAHASTVTQVADDEVGLVNRFVEILRGGLRDVHVARAVETIAANVVLLVHFAGDGIHVRRLGNSHVESSVENSNLRGAMQASHIAVS